MLKTKKSQPPHSFYITTMISGEGVRKSDTKKMGLKTKAKPKVNSFSNIGHVPGGGRVKVKTIYF